MQTDEQMNDALLRVLAGKTRVGVGYQQLTVTGASAQSLTVPATANYAEITVESATTSGYVVRYLKQGSTTLPTTTVGVPLANGTVFDIDSGTLLADFRVIAITGSHTLNIEYFK